jgi:ABC-type cobalt transport system substrate-binding protein
MGEKFVGPDPPSDEVVTELHPKTKPWGSGVYPNGNLIPPKPGEVRNPLGINGTER